MLHKKHVYTNIFHIAKNQVHQNDMSEGSALCYTHDKDDCGTPYFSPHHDLLDASALLRDS